ncbi:serine/threonine protein kinase [Paucimonas lemoignei]|uniref:Serine/threonine protein kinase n=1 Tax=Paucimonas lemoignei TaxID=29443 RepID=A0A4R3HV74_PAULE|nr:serine/threonine-protein kinase [Paucimonas lemoignei]TCS35955.1 serine/threonine protein kinase [Paucimonas lemoignei]
MMNQNQDNAQSAVRTRRLVLRPDMQGDEEISTNVLPVGTHLGEFEIKALIGEGGFGIVYLAYDHSLERLVALKEYMPSGLASRTTRMAVSVRSQKKLDTFTAGLKSFINEARMLAQFDSPSLVKVHSFWEGNGTAYMVMPYYEGVTLKQALQSHKIKPTEGWIRMLLADLCDAIDILHRAHCLHRDIAPDNILLLKDGRPLLLDFGAARRVIGDLTQCFTAILKPGFAPIEQYADIAGLRQGAWTDIYALAAVVYYLITGKAPPPSVARMVHDELVPAREAGKGRYSEAFLSTIDKALSVRPEHRFHSIDELRHALNITEPEPRTVPYPGGEWSTTVARTEPVATQLAGKPMPAHAAPSGAPGADAGDDMTAIAPPGQTNKPAPLRPAAASSAGKAAPVKTPAPEARQGRQQFNAHASKAPPSFDTPPVPPREPISPAPFSAAVPRSSRKAPADSSMRIEPELHPTQMASNWHATGEEPPMPPPIPPHLHEQDVSLPRRRNKQGWLIFALLFAAGIGSGIYLGTNHSWDGLSGSAVDSDTPDAAAAASSGRDPAGDASDQALAARSAPNADGNASSGSSDSSAASGSAGSLGAPDESQDSVKRLRSEIELWKSASKSNQASDYARYLREYPQGLYAAIAKLRLERLQASAAPKPATPEPKPAAPAPKTAAQDAKPAAPDAKLAEAAKPTPEAPALKTRPEEAAWTRATSINSAAAYQDYLRKYPKGGYSALARDRLANIKLAEAGKATSPQPEIRLAPSATLAPATPATQTEAKAAKPDAPLLSAATSKPQESAAIADSANSSSGGESKSASAASGTSAQPVTTPTPTTAPSAQPPASQTVAASTTSSTASSAPAASSQAAVKAPPALPPQASLKHQDRDSGSDTGSDASGHRSIKVDDQTMTGNFTVDKNTGLVSGKGKVSWSNGNQFEGTLVQGSKEGKGRFVWNSGQRYSGDWAHDAPNGKGTFLFPDGSRYDGEVKDGLPHGQGTTKFKNGVVYTGNWVRGKSHGHGRYIWTDGSYWEGEFRDDKRTENGKMYYPSKNTPTTGSVAPSLSSTETQRAAALSAEKTNEEQ